MTKRFLTALLLVACFAGAASAQDKKISELTTSTSLTYDDYIPTVDDPAGTPTTKKITVANALGQAVNAQTGTTYTVLSTDSRKLVTFTNGSSIAVTLPQANSTTFHSGFYFAAQNRGAGTVTITPTTSTIDGAASLALAQNEGCLIFSDGTNYFSMRGKTIASPAASDTAAGVVELATAAETSTGTDAARAVTPDGLAGSDFGKSDLIVEVFAPTTDTATGDGKFYIPVPAKLNGRNLVAVSAQVVDAGTTGTLNIDLARCAAVATGNQCSGTVADMLSTNLTIDSTENKSSTAAAAAVIDTGNDDVATDQVIRIDIDAVHTTAAKGLVVTLTFQLP
jgi:hypothetical protein